MAENKVEYKKLTEVELIEEPGEGATVLAEENGRLRRVPYEKVGGGAAVATAIIKSSDYDDVLERLKNVTGEISAIGAPAVTYSCINMTFDEAYALMASGQPLQAVGMLVTEGPMIAPGYTLFTGQMLGVPCIAFAIDTMSGMVRLYWTANGLSMDVPRVSPNPPT